LHARVIGEAIRVPDFRQIAIRLAYLAARSVTLSLALHAGQLAPIGAYKCIDYIRDQRVVDLAPGFVGAGNARDQPLGAERAVKGRVLSAGLLDQL